MIEYSTDKSSYTDTNIGFTEIGNYIVYFRITATGYEDYDGQISIDISEIANIVFYRLYNPNTGEHLFTPSVGEYNKLGKAGWKKEGKSFDGYNAKGDGLKAVYRVHNPNAKGGDHYYTASKGEAKYLISIGWKWDLGGKAMLYTKGSFEMIKMYNPNNGRHHYTPKKGEALKLKKLGWVYEGTAWTVEKYY